MPLEVLVDWATSTGSPGVSVLMFNRDTPVNTARGAINTLLTALAPVLSVDTRWTVRDAGRALDDATGALVGFWTAGVAYSGVGSGGSTALANATQILLRWQTDAIVGGRRLQGRTFIPGIATGANVDGELKPANAATVAAAATAFVGGGSAFGVWHRPVDGSGGVFEPASAAGVWNEFAVQRGRR